MAVTITQVEAQLAQTQCTECGYAGCQPYAQALLEDNAATNLCRPGGVRVAKALSQLLSQPYQEPAQAPRAERVIEIDANTCIGCTLCIQNCPTDAILGAPKQLHAVVEDRCTGCGLCVAPCPVDCISFAAVDRQGAEAAESAERAKQVGIWVQTRQQRLQQSGKRTRVAAATKPTKRRGGEISADVAARIAAARAEAQARYSKKQLPPPRALQTEE